MTIATAGKAQLTFQINYDDLGPLFSDKLSLECNSLSPVAEALKGYSKGSRRASAGAAEISAHPLFPMAASILANPDLRMLHRTGGGSVDVSFFAACRNRSVKNYAIVTVTPSFENSTLVQIFDGPDDYLVWWLDALATPVEDSIANYMPPPMALESLVYHLHAIDAYRRAAFQSMLSFAPTGEPSISVKQFVDTMGQALGSRDLRWLLPSFLYLTPGLDGYKFEPRQEHLEGLAEHDFLLTAKRAGSAEDIFLFGEAGCTMGVEFYRTWMSAAGFETAILTPEGQRVLSQGFLAPTALANHLFRLEADGSGRCLVNHQAMTLDELAGKAREMLFGALEAQPSGVTAPVAAVPAKGEPLTPAQVEPSQRTCSACGNVNVSEARFCSGCGKPL